ncbi:hypothetical protein B488_06540 [Liberibacter crescens BT-1]|uniref:ATP-grasp domain-containing protein n=1 Tax=Liberibacter crescens (strain BT-1) TaxID=1215343 RepID=L0EW97_LIBCB|nr:ATP-grasp domain-containing protein [Liberibacter crescens]AGA64646.1 hypothetical protein B488_06540 [Liberibacter crescens BT-1]AMC12758.1 hypothetical protein RL73_03380 [Liberibacter crescens]
MSKDTVIIVDPFLAGTLIAPELEKKGIQCYAVISSDDIPDRFLKSYTSEGFVDKILYSAEEIKNHINFENVLAVVPGTETGVYCTEELSAFYNVKRNNHLTTDWRRKKSVMQEKLVEAGLNSILSKRISQENTSIDDLNSSTGYVIKPDNSCLTDGVVFVDSKQDAVKWISQIDWKKKNIIGARNDFYLVQEKIDGEEFVVDLVADKKGIKVCTLCKYKKGLHNGSHFVYESLEVLDVNDPNYIALVEYAKNASIVLGVEFGLAHLEIMNTKKGPTLIELGARLHGGIAPLVFKKCYSPGLLQSFVDVLTQEFNTAPSTLKNKARIVFLINENENVKIPDINTLQDKIKAIHGVEHVKLFINNNEIIPLTIDLGNCPGIVSLIADRDVELDLLEKTVRDTFQ